MAGAADAAAMSGTDHAAPLARARRVRGAGVVVLRGHLWCSPCSVARRPAAVRTGVGRAPGGPAGAGVAAVRGSPVAYWEVHSAGLEACSRWPGGIRRSGDERGRNICSGNICTLQSGA